MVFCSHREFGLSPLLLLLLRILGSLQTRLLAFGKEVNSGIELEIDVGKALIQLSINVVDIGKKEELADGLVDPVLVVDGHYVPRWFVVCFFFGGGGGRWRRFSLKKTI